MQMQAMDCALAHDVDPTVGHGQGAPPQIEAERARKARDARVELARQRGEGRRAPLHAARGGVRGVAARVVARRPAPSGGIVRAQLAAFREQPRVELAPPRGAQAMKVNQRRKQRPQRHAGASMGARARLVYDRSSMVVSSFPARGESPPPAPAGAATVPHWIGGRAVSGAGPALEVFDPASGTVARHVACALPAEVAAAVASAQSALPAWANTPPVRRARVLARFVALLTERRDALAALITSEHGKVLSDAQGEVTRGIEIAEFHLGIPQLLKGDFTEQVSSGIDNWTLRQPLR